MLRKMGGVVLLVIAVWAAMLAPALAGVMPAAAQDGPDARTTYDLNLRTGPGTGHTVVAVLPAGTGLVFEARTGDMAWLLGRTVDGAARGWVASLYLAYEPGFTPARLPVSSEVIAAAPAAPPGQPADPAPSALHPPQSIGWQTPAIFARGRELGNKPNVFIRLGDSITAEQRFLYAYAGKGYFLGPYEYLQDTIDFFAGTFGLRNETAKSGYTSASINDAGWSNPAFCLPGETPLLCEYRLKKPAVAIIYFGPNDMQHMSLGSFDANMTMLVNNLIDLGVIPVLTTFAISPQMHPGVDQLFLAVIRRIAADQGVPLIEFHDAANTVPGCGVIEDGYHLSIREDGLMVFTGDQAVFGATLRELMTLQMLDELRRTVLQAG